MINTKFRGKVKNTLEWVEGDYFRENHLGLIRHAIIRYERLKGCDVVYEVIPETVSHFTGLTDKSGKDIYEGDIVKWDDCSKGKYWRFAVVEINPDIQFNCSAISEIDNIKNSTKYCFKYGNFIYKDTCNHFEIIGNIHDNPELLTSK